MTLSVVARFLFGHSDSIRTVASNRAAFLTGLLLVVLTAIARNYDQTFILEKPILWSIGPLIFSVFSGTWIFLVAYGIAWGYMDAQRPRLLDGWPAFMGLFWMTAPIAWLYAIPVERFFDSLTAARANVVLLIVVSIWRVLLMARVFQVLHGANFVMTLAWILIPATVEVLGISIFGGGLSKRIMAGMMGMRNSPEEEILLKSIGTASTIALYVLPAAIAGTVIWRMKRFTMPLPPRIPGTVPRLSLGVAAVFWVGVAILPQCELSRNLTLETLLRKKEFRRALDYFSAHRLVDFAPSRPLPPKPFEPEIFEHLPRLLAAAKSSDAPWVHQHLLLRLDQMCSHFTSRWGGVEKANDSRDEHIKQMAQGMHWSFMYSGPTAADIRDMLDGLERMSVGHKWLRSNDLFLPALAKFASEPSTKNGAKHDWEALVAHLEKYATNNPALTSSQPVP